MSVTIPDEYPLFVPWPKIARLNRDIVITEKIDGTNAAIVIREYVPGDDNSKGLLATAPDGRDTLVYVHSQSRNKFIAPGKSTDNAGFAGWVQDNVRYLIDTLGVGIHYGEWWGQGIQRKYGLDHKRFSLFNTARWAHLADDAEAADHGLYVVPVLYAGPFSEDAIKGALEDLAVNGSLAAANEFFDPEGIVIWHEAARQSFKVTLKGDEAPKSLHTEA